MSGFKSEDLREEYGERKKDIVELLRAFQEEADNDFGYDFDDFAWEDLTWMGDVQRALRALLAHNTVMPVREKV